MCEEAFNAEGLTSASWTRLIQGGCGGGGGGGGWDFPLTHLTSPAPLFVHLQVGVVGPVLPVPETKGLHAERLGGGQSDSWTDIREPATPHQKHSDVTCLFAWAH